MNDKKTQLRTGVWITYPNSFNLSGADEIMLEESVKTISDVVRQEVYAVHLNTDRDDTERLHNVNIVFHKKK